MNGGIDIISDTTGKEIVNAIGQVAQALGYEEKETQSIEYGVRWITGASSPTLERVTRQNGIVSKWDVEFTPNIGDKITDNPFDNISLFNPKPVSDEDGNIFRRFKRFYVGEQQIGIYSYIWVCNSNPYEFYRIPRAFYHKGELKWNYVDIGAYEGGMEVINGVNYLCSKPGYAPASNKTRTVFNDMAKAWKTKHNGADNEEFYCITTMSEITEILQPLLLIMFGTRNSQSIYNGVCDVDTDDYEMSYTENNTNRILMSNNAAYAQQFHVGACVWWGTWRAITENGTVTVGGVTYFYIKLDGEPFDTVAGDGFWRGAVVTGLTDEINATHGTVSNDGTHSFKALGIENIYGNLYKFILDCTLVNKIPYICTDLEAWTETTTPASNAAFAKCSYTLSTSGWITELTRDSEHPDVCLHTANGGSDSTYYCDYGYTGTSTTTVYSCWFGGCYNASSGVGLFYWDLNYSVTYTNYYVGARLSRRAL